MVTVHCQGPTQIHYLISVGIGILDEPSGFLAEAFMGALEFSVPYNNDPGTLTEIL